MITINEMVNIFFECFLYLRISRPLFLMRGVFTPPFRRSRISASQVSAASKRAAALNHANHDDDQRKNQQQVDHSTHGV